MMTELTIDQITTLAGAMVIVSGLTEVIIRTLNWDSGMQGRFGPALAILLGIVVVGLAAAVTGTSIPQGILTGILAGFAAMGVHGVAQSATVTGKS